MQFLRALAVVGFAFVAGCVTPPQTPINLAEGYFGARTDRIGVAMSELPAPDTLFPGADCLLCLAFAAGANTTLSNAVRTWTTDELLPLKAELVALLGARGQNVVAIEEPLKMDAFPDRRDAEANFARKDFSALAKKAGVNRLLVVNVRSLGAWRNYAAYVPTGAPRAVFKGEAYIVDLANHKLDWYQRVDLDRPSEGNWDEPPKFPGLTNAHFQVIELGKDSIKRPFGKQ